MSEQERGPGGGASIREVAIRDGEIRLAQFLKLADLVGAGSDARPLLQAGGVSVNGEVELRRGRRLHPGDVVSLDETHVRVGGAAAASGTAAGGPAPGGPGSGGPGSGGMALFELGDPGPMRDRLVAAVLRGEKRATTSLEVFYRIERSPLPRPGDRATLAGSAGEALGTVEILDVTVARLADVDDDVATAEGEGFRDATEWRSSHTHYWEGFTEAVRSHLRDQDWVLDDDTPVVVEWFRLLPPGETAEH